MYVAREGPGGRMMCSTHAQPDATFSAYAQHSTEIAREEMILNDRRAL